MEEDRAEIIKERSAERYDMEGLNIVFWGLLFTAINIRIQGFDIVPDVVGYLIVINGLGKIEKYDVKFSSAKKTAYLLAALALINIYQAPADRWESWGTEAAGLQQTTQDSVLFSAGLFGNNPWLALLFMCVGTVASLYFAFSMCAAMKAVLNKMGDHVLAEICDNRWKLILAAQTGLLVSLLIAPLGVPLAMILAIIFGILALIALIMFLLLIRHTYRSINDKIF